MDSMPFFISTHELVSETPLPSSSDRKSAIALLHDHTTVQNLQPLVISDGNKVIDTPGSNEWVVIEATSVCPDGVPIEYRSVTISVPFGPFGSKLITSTSAYMDTENGVLVAFQAPMGLHGRNQYRIVENENGDGLLLREEAALTGVSIMMPFVMGQERESHTKHRMNIAEELGKRASAGSKDAVVG